MKLKIEVKKCIIIDGKPYISVHAAAKSLAMTVAIRYANRLRERDIDARYFDHAWKRAGQASSVCCLYVVYGVSLLTYEQAMDVKNRRKRAYKKLKTRMEKYLLD